MADYSDLEDKINVISNLDNIQELLSWDQEVMMPEKGTKARSKQSSVLSTIVHQILTGDEMTEIMESIDKNELSEEQKVNFREMKRRHERFKDVPEDLIERISEASSESVDAWRKAREEDDFEMFASHLSKIVELKRELAEHIDSDSEPYEVLFRDYEPHVDLAVMESMLEKLGERLPEVLETIRENGGDIETEALQKKVDVETQREISESMLEDLCFDSSRGRLDISTHPFTSGNQFDARITTRFSEESFQEGIMATIHECGHALYQLGLPQDHYGDFMGESREIGFHESQSRLLENHIGRSRDFWKYLLPKLEEKTEEFEDVDLEDCFESVNQVKEDNLIRIQSDELTYHLHILVRFELGRKLVNGEIEVEELPELWNEKMEEHLGIRPQTDSEGVLQDIHWAWGNFGYFPTYTLGSVIAAQIYSKMDEDINIEQAVEEGEFEVLVEWLRENVHSYGCRYPTDEFIEEITGEQLKVDYFLEYIESKYGELYDVELG